MKIKAKQFISTRGKNYTCKLLGAFNLKNSKLDYKKFDVNL
jgi:hypothetical protein